MKDTIILKLEIDENAANLVAIPSAVDAIGFNPTLLQSFFRLQSFEPLLQVSFSSENIKNKRK